MKWLFSSVFGIIGVVLLLVGCPFMAVGAGTYYFVQARTSDWVPATGTVTGMERTSTTDSDGNPTETYCPYVEFATAEGETIEVSANDCSNPPAYETGDPVELKYNPANPQEIQLKGGTVEIIGVIFTWVFGGLGVLMVIGGVVLGIIGIVIVMRRG